MTSRPGDPRGDRGAVTAELALTLPLLLAVTSGLVWLLAVGVAQVRTVDAAREVARAVARGDAETEAIARGADVAPRGARVRVGRVAGRVVVTVEATVTGPGGLLAAFPAPTVQAEAVAAAEDAP